MKFLYAFLRINRRDAEDAEGRGERGEGEYFFLEKLMD